MCGLVGHVVMSEQKIDIDAVSQGCLALTHRGPDGSGLVELDHCGLAHRRLSVIDIEGSIQPWRSSCGRYYMVFNGEIYNYRELRKELEGRDFRFRSKGDTEVLMNLYIEFGEACLDKLNGMFVFAIWDTHNKALFIARDRLGEKPLYYAEKEGQLAFASELIGLAGFRFIDRSLDHIAVQDFFAHQFIGEERTIYSGIRKLQPGHWLYWQKGRIKKRRYWKLTFTQQAEADETALFEELRYLLQDSMQMRLRADVPLGMFLSGGLDSSLVAYITKDMGYDLRAFTIGFNDLDYDERENARRTARELKLNQQIEVVDLNGVKEINKILDAFGEPYADPSAVPTWKLCHFARKEVTVALSGDGADELFGGYRRYLARFMMQRLRVSPHRMKNRVFDRFISILPETSVYYGNNPVKKFRLLYRLISNIVESPGDPLAQTFSLSELQRLLGTGTVCQSFDFVSDLAIMSLESVNQMMVTDQFIYLPEDILVKVDRMSMQHSLEVRTPFLDHRLVEFAAKVPLKFKIRRGIQKYLLKQCYRKQLPRHILQRPKHGFSVPLGRWFRQGLRKPFEELVMDGNVAADILDKKEIKTIWQQHQRGRVDNGFKLWSLYAFCRWYDRKTYQ